MFKFLENLLGEYSHHLIYKSMYGLKVKADPKRDKQIKKVIVSMGDKYLLAKPIPKLKDRAK